MNQNIKDNYWDYVTTQIIETINKCSDNNIPEFKITKLNLIANLTIMFESEDKFNDIIDNLRKSK